MVKIILGLLILIGGILFLTKGRHLSLYRILSRGSALLTFGFLTAILLFICSKGLLHFRWSMLSVHYTSENLSMMPSIITTVIVVIMALITAVPVGVFTAVYLVEYAAQSSKVVQVIRLATETLSGIPSIIYGLFGMLFFVLKLKMSFSILSGSLTVAIMILPLVIRSGEEALHSVHPKLREGSFALGAGKLRTIFVVVLPAAIPGILSGVILAVGRVIGETAALIYTLGTATAMPTSLSGSSRTLALHMYMLAGEGLHTGEAYATGMVLLVLVFVINFVSTKIADRWMGVR